MSTILPAYNFGVRIGILPLSLGFQKVSGIQSSIETITYQEGGMNRSVHVFPKGVLNAGTLIMEKGRFLLDPIQFLLGERINYLSIDVMSNDHLVLKTYIVKDALVKKWSVSDMNAQENGLLIDRFELEYGELYFT